MSLPAREIPSFDASELAAVGDVVARPRRRRSLDLDTLADRAGVPVDVLALLEAGQFVPDVRFPWALATALDVPLGAVLASPGPDTATFRVQRAGRRRAFESATTGFRTRAVFPVGDPYAPEVYELTLAPGSFEAAAPHARNTYEHLTVVRGVLVVQTDDRQARLGPGDARFFRADREARRPAAARGAAATGASLTGRPEGRAHREGASDMFAPAVDHIAVADGFERCIRILVAEHLGVGAADLAPEVSLVDDLAADSLDLVEIALAIEANLGVVLPRNFLDDVRTCGELIEATLSLTRDHRRRAGDPDGEPVALRARLTPHATGSGGGAGDRPWAVERVVLLTPYAAESLADDALRAGAGAHLELRLAARTPDDVLIRVRDRFCPLRERGIDVDVRRDSGSRMRPHDDAA